MDSLRYWVQRDARRRLPLRPRERAGARAVRRRPARRVLRHHPPGSGAVAGEADRRAVGPRRGRLPGRQLSRAVDRVERQVPRHGAAVLARRRRHGVRARDAARPAATICTRSSGRRPYASINFVTAHDGFTLHDLVSYNEKHNEANGEDNRDGENNNLSWNCGVEGPTDDRGDQRAARAAGAQLPRDAAAVAGRADDQRRRRARADAARQQQRVLPGQRDHLDRLEPRPTSSRQLLDFTRSWFTSGCRSRCSGAASIFRAAASAAVKDVAWLAPDGREMTDEAWNADFVRCLGMLLNGDAIEEVDERGELIVGDTLLILLNAHSDRCRSRCRRSRASSSGSGSSTRSDPAAAERVFKPGAHYPLQVAVRSLSSGSRRRSASAAAREPLSGPPHRRPLSSTRRNLSARKGDRGSRRPRVGNRESRAARQRRRGRDRQSARRPRRHRERAAARRRWPVSDQANAGRAVDVRADIFADGHDVLTVLLRDRYVPANRKRHTWR